MYYTTTLVAEKVKNRDKQNKISLANSVNFEFFDKNRNGLFDSCSYLTSVETIECFWIILRFFGGIPLKSLNFLGIFEDLFRNSLDILWEFKLSYFVYFSLILREREETKTKYSELKVNFRCTFWYPWILKKKRTNYFLQLLGKRMV